MNPKFNDIFKQHTKVTAHLVGTTGMDSVSAERAAHLILEARKRYVWAAEAVEQAADRIEQDMQRTRREAQRAANGESSSINSLGVLQGSGPDLDRKCALLGTASDNLGTIESTFDVSEVF